MNTEYQWANREQDHTLDNIKISDKTFQSTFWFLPNLALPVCVFLLYHIS